MLKTIVIAADPCAVIELKGRTQSLSKLKIFGLSLLKRLVLTAKKANFERVFILTDSQEQFVIADQLKDDRLAGVSLQVSTLPAEIRPGSAESLALLRLAEPFVFVSGESLFDFRLLEAIGIDWRENHRPLVVPEAGMFVCAPKDLNPLLATADTRESVLATTLALAREGKWRRFEPNGHLSRPLKTKEDLQQAKDALYRGNGKKSDGIYANFNKRVVARPLMNVILQTPITPNMVTLTGLLFGILSGVIFAFGGYWYTLGGAFLLYLSSLLDHCDGMMARLKFQESAFGCWLETASDYSSYVAAFAGMGIGLYKHTGNIFYAYIGALFVFGCVLSFLATGYQRKKFSNDQPQDYINRLHTKMEARMSNPIYYFSRKCYFLTRRAFFPYAILAFAILDLTWFFIMLCAFGANLFWILTLNTNRLFNKADTSAQT
ncbi:MAG: CDP-alcohol phosphatidyltransferase family protein [Acidobacteriota bacterium]